MTSAVSSRIKFALLDMAIYFKNQKSLHRPADKCLEFSFIFSDKSDVYHLSKMYESLCYVIDIHEKYGLDEYGKSLYDIIEDDSSITVLQNKLMYTHINKIISNVNINDNIESLLPSRDTDIVLFKILYCVYCLYMGLFELLL
jgi:hypothetical protein